MKQSLQLHLAHQLTLTPQLQQAVRLLQLSTLDLQQEIQQQLTSNPMLEETPSDEETLDDFQWSPVPVYPCRNNPFNESGAIYETHGTIITLQEHLRWQLALTPVSAVDNIIAIALIDAINDDGFLTISMADLHQSLNSPEHPIDIEELETVRHRIQQFDPIGCGAIDWVEALSVQLNALPATPCLTLAKQLITQHKELLAHHNYRQLMKIYHVDADALDEALQLIQQLNPKPGSLFSTNKTEYVIPDLYVKKIQSHWGVYLNQTAIPHVGINNQYASLIRHVNSTADHQFLKNTLREARWFLKSIQSRQETLLKVAQYIVNYQQAFLELGVEAMKPLTLDDVAHALDIHESTVSRITTQKFIHTPRGLFELKYFFSSHIATSVGGLCSSTAIRALIKKLIADEPSQKPLSDSKLVQFIEKQGIHIARRTVAKYREAMGIAPSNERKSIRS